jgi:hypothetical protein
MAKMERQSPYEVIKSQNEKKLERSTPQERSILGKQEIEEPADRREGKGRRLRRTSKSQEVRTGGINQKERPD